MPQCGQKNKKVFFCCQTIENQRKQLAKSNHVPAQDFQQRDYSDVDNEYKNQLAEEIRMAKLHNPEIFKA